MGFYIVKQHLSFLFAKTIPYRLIECYFMEKMKPHDISKKVLNKTINITSKFNKLRPFSTSGDEV